MMMKAPDLKMMNETRAYLGMPPLTREEIAEIRLWDKITGVPMLAPESETDPDDLEAELDSAPKTRAADGVSLAEIGESLRAAREEYGLSLGELEEATGMSRGRLSRIERGVAPNPTIETLTRIAEALGLWIAVTLQPAEEKR